MPKIKRVTQPNIKPPDLSSIGQNINIPRGAFGENVDEAISNLGRSVEFSAQKLGEAFDRHEERRAISEASAAFKDVPINALNDLNEAKRNPGYLPIFQQKITADFDNKMREIRKGLSERAGLKFDEKVLATRTAMAKNAATWARTEEILQGRNNMNSEIVNQISAAAGDIGNLQGYRDEVIRLINEANLSGFLRDGRGKRMDAALMVRKTLRAMDLEIANTLVVNNPAALREMIEGDTPVLAFLSTDDKRKLETMAVNSSKNLAERKEVTTRDAYFEKNTEFAKKFQDRILTWGEANREAQSLQDLVDFGDEDAKKQQAMILRIRDRLAKPDSVLDEEAKNAAIRRITATAEAKKELGIPPKKVKPLESVRARATVAFTNRFLDFDVRKTGRKNRKEFKVKSASVRLSDLLEFQADIEEALDLQLITLAQHNAWTTKLLPTLRGKIESKHFQERKGLFVVDRSADKYSDAFTHVLDTLEDTDLNTPENQADALLFAFQIAEELDPEKEQDILKKREALQSIGQRAMNELYRKLIPEINSLTDDQMPNSVIQFKPTQASQRSVDFLLANPTDANVKFFNDKFGKGTAEKILAE